MKDGTHQNLEGCFPSCGHTDIQRHQIQTGRKESDVHDCMRVLHHAQPPCPPGENLRILQSSEISPLWGVHCFRCGAVPFPPHAPLNASYRQPCPIKTTHFAAVPILFSKTNGNAFLLDQSGHRVLLSTSDVTCLTKWLPTTAGAGAPRLLDILLTLLTLQFLPATGGRRLDTSFP